MISSVTAGPALTRSIWLPAALTSGYLQPLHLVTCSPYIWLPAALTSGHLQLLDLVTCCPYIWLPATIRSGYLQPLHLVTCSPYIWLPVIWLPAALRYGYLQPWDLVTPDLVVYSPYIWLLAAFWSGFMCNRSRQFLCPVSKNVECATTASGQRTLLIVAIVLLSCSLLVFSKVRLKSAYNIKGAFKKSSDTSSRVLFVTLKVRMKKYLKNEL